MRYFRFIVGLFFFFASFSFANSYIKLFPNSWQMVGVGFDYNLSRDLPYSSDDFSVAWSYKNGKWSAFSKDPSIISLIKQKGLWGDFVPKNGAFWIMPKKELLYPNFRDRLDTIHVEPGWNMVGVTNWASDIYQMKDSGLKSFFTYRKGQWKYLYRNSQGDYTGELKSISFNEGAWAYNDTNNTKILKTFNVKHYWNGLYSNKKFILPNDKYFILDQNGTVLSNDSNLSGMQWYMFRVKDDYVSFDLENDNLDITYHIYKTDANNWQITSEHVFSLDPSETGIMYVKNLNYDLISSPIPITITDYQKDVNITQAVATVMDNLKNLLTNGDADADTVLSNAKTTLQNYPNDNDAKVALAFVSLIETLNDSAIGNSLDINSTSLQANSFFSSLKNYGGSLPDEAIKLASNISDYDTSARNILDSLSNHLSTAADKLEKVANDKNYVFNYAPIADGAKMNYVDIKALQAVMYLTSSKLELLSAYQLGDNDWLEPVTEKINDANVSYVKAGIDPVGFIKSGTFFVSPSQEKLTKAKDILLKALNSYNVILKNHWYGKGLYLSGDDMIGTRETGTKRDIYLAIKNLKGEIPSFCFVEDDVNFDFDINQYSNKITKNYIDLSSLFNASTAVKATDFPNPSYNGTWNETKSKELDAPVDTNGNELDINFTDDPKSYMTHLFLDSSNSTHNVPGEYVFSALGYDWHRRYTEPKYYGNEVKKIDNGDVEFIAYYKAPNSESNGKSRAQAKVKLHNNPADEISITFTPKEFLNAPHSKPEIRFIGFNWVDDKNGGLFTRIKLLGNHSNKFCYQVNAYINHEDSATQYCADMNKQIEENHQYTLLIKKALDNSKYIFNMYEGSTMDDNLLMISKSISLSELKENTKDSYKLLYPEDGNSFKTKKFRSVEVKVLNSDANSSSSDFKTVVEINGAEIHSY